MKRALGLLLAAILSVAQSDLNSRLDSIAGKSVTENRAVGISAAVAQGGRTLLLKGYGKADIESGAAVNPDTVMAIGSVSKQVTAVAILQLRDQGKLTLDDPLTKWLPDFDTRGNTVTLRHLLAHTSGIAELTEMPEIRALRAIRNPGVTRDQIYQIVRGTPFKFATGTQHVYTNTNYWLLGMVIEKASGMTYEDYVEKRIFAPLGMTRSMYCNDAEPVANRAAGHGMRGGTAGRVPPIVHTATYSAGAICSTAADMLVWLHALHGGKVLSPASYKELVTPAKLGDGTALRYSMGTAIEDDRNGLRFIGHSGGGFGYSAEARWYPAAKLAIVVLTNSEPDEITAVTERIAAAVMLKRQ